MEVGGDVGEEGSVSQVAAEIHPSCEEIGSVGSCSRHDAASGRLRRRHEFRAESDRNYTRTTSRVIPHSSVYVSPQVEENQVSENRTLDNKLIFCSHRTSNRLIVVVCVAYIVDYTTTAC